MGTIAQLREGCLDPTRQSHDLLGTSWLQMWEMPNNHNIIKRVWQPGSLRAFLTKLNSVIQVRKMENLCGFRYWSLLLSNRLTFLKKFWISSWVKQLLDSGYWLWPQWTQELMILWLWGWRGGTSGKKWLGSKTPGKLVLQPIRQVIGHIVWGSRKSRATASYRGPSV